MVPVDQRPHQPLVRGPVLRHNHLEHKPFSSRVKVGRLSLVASPEIELVLLPDRHIDLLLGVSVVITEVKVVSAVGIALPPIKGRTYILSSGVSRGERELSAKAAEPYREQK